MIAHIDCDAFFASVLQRRNPRLKGKPILALGMGGGFVIAASYEAKAKGVRTGMRFIEARKLCPEANPIVSDFLESCVVSDRIEKILETKCPRVEKMSVDEWFLDLTTCVGGLPKNLDKWAQSVQSEVTKKIGISISVGIAPTKLLAKMASEYRKPAGISIVDEEGSLTIEQFLKDRPAPAIPGIGSKRQLHADSYNWKTAWDIANAPKDIIKRLFGKPGLEMQEELLGTPVEDIICDPEPPKSISRCRSFRATKDQSRIFGYFLQHLSYCILRMRSHKLGCKEVMVWLRDDAYLHSGRPRKLPQVMDTEEQILPYARWCFRKICEEGKSYTQIGVALLKLHPAGEAQYSLFEEPERTDDAERVQKSLDAIRERYGRDAIVRGPGITIEKRHKKKKANEPDMYGNIPTVL
ncbi:DNA polymerase IV [Patescibacteria group bacterium]|nr:DNA polymerase IV [Patescibacteria group bacterium]MBU2259259.1 DNA polymerase IV [Patescibacteria group bacterium]